MILFFGYLNYGNFGDDLLLQIASEDITDFQTLSSKNSLLEHFFRIKTANELVLLGGLFQDLSSIRSSLYYFSVILFAKLLGKKIKFLSTGIGPLRTNLTQLITRLSYRLGDEVSVRDQYSSKFLKAAGISHKLVPDLALSFKYDESLVNKEKIPQGDFYIISINPHLSPVIASATKQSPGNNTLEIICEPSQKPNAEDYIYTKDFNTHELIYLLKHHCKSLLTQRFHLAILAELAGIDYSTTQDCHKVMNLSPRERFIT